MRWPVSQQSSALPCCFAARTVHSEVALLVLLRLAGLDLVVTHVAVTGAFVRALMCTAMMGP